MEKSILTVDILDKIGAFEETHDLYECLLDVCNSAKCKFLEERGIEALKWPGQWEVLVTKVYRDKLDDYIFKYGHIFSEEFPRLHTNNHSMRGFSMLNWSAMNILEPNKYRYITFREFLYKLSFVIVYCIGERIWRKKPKMPLEVIWEKTEQRVLDISERMGLEKYRVGSDKMVRQNSEVYSYRRLSLLSCNQKKHRVIPKLLAVQALLTQTRVLIPVHHCETCNRTFIGEETLKFYENRFGKLAVCVTHDTSANSTGAYGELNSESLLHKLGYNVVEGELSQTERRKFLIYLIEGKKISFFQACRDIENAIKIFEYRPTYRRAVQRWREDLAFINEYMENKTDENS